MCTEGIYSWFTNNTNSLTEFYSNDKKEATNTYRKIQRMNGWQNKCCIINVGEKKKYKCIRAGCTSGINLNPVNERRRWWKREEKSLEKKNEKNICRPVARVATVMVVVWLHSYWHRHQMHLPFMFTQWIEIRWDRERKTRAHDEQHSFYFHTLSLFPFIRFWSFSVLNLVMEHVVSLIDFINRSYFSIWVFNMSAKYK